jgi:hypothetical protein
MDDRVALMASGVTGPEASPMRWFRQAYRAVVLFEAITPMLSGRPGPRVRSSFTKGWLVCQTRSLRPSGA